MVRGFSELSEFLLSGSNSGTKLGVLGFSSLLDVMMPVCACMIFFPSTIMRGCVIEHE